MLLRRCTVGVDLTEPFACRRRSPEDHLGRGVKQYRYSAGGQRRQEQQDEKLKNGHNPLCHRRCHESLKGKKRIIQKAILGAAPDADADSACSSVMYGAAKRLNSLLSTGR